MTESWHHVRNRISSIGTLWLRAGWPASSRTERRTFFSHQSMSIVPKFARPNTAPRRFGPGSRELGKNLVSPLEVISVSG